MITPEKVLQMSCPRLLCRWFFGPSKLYTKWTPYVVMGESQATIDRMHVYCGRCHRGCPETHP